MSQYYTSKRSSNLFDPRAKAPFRLSRSKLDLFMECPRCFYLDRRLGVGRPPGFPFNLNSAVDHLLKKEFDLHRAKGEAHPLMQHYKVDAVPFRHEQLNTWRENFKGITHLDTGSNFILTGAIDDVWVNPQGELIIVDYKATAKDTEVNLDAEWQRSYKRQMEIYQWLFRQNRFVVSPVGYFVYCNGRRDREAFDAKLEFDIKLIPYAGKDAWVPQVLVGARKCLEGDLPKAGQTCDYCAYRLAAGGLEVKTQTQAKAAKQAPAKKAKKPVLRQGSALF